MNAMQRAFLKSIAPKIEADSTFYQGTEAAVFWGVLKATKADARRRTTDKGWDTKLSFKTYSKLNQQGVV